MANGITRDVSWVVATSATVSSVVTLNSGDVIVGFTYPAIFDGTSVSITASADGTNFYAVKDREGNAFTITTTDDTGGYVVLDPANSFGLYQLKFTSNASQVADVTCGLIVRKA